MKTKNIAGLPVVASGKLIGILTKRDLEFSESEGTVKDIMTKDVITADENVSIEDAKYVLYKNRVENFHLLIQRENLSGL